MAPSSRPFEGKSNASTSDRERRETERLTALDHLDAVRPEVDSVLQQLVDDVREAFGTDLCMVNLILSDVQYFRAWSGELPGDLAEARQDPRERSMCQYVVETQKPLVVEDFLATEKFKDQHFRVRYGIRFYAGTPLVTSEGHVIGTLCLLGTQPKEITEEQMALLGAFAKVVVGRLELLGSLRREQTIREDEARRGRKLQLMLDSSQDMIATIGADGAFKTINRSVGRVLGYEAEELVGCNYLDLVHPEDRNLSTKLTGVIEDGTRECRIENRCLHKDGNVVCIEWNVTVIPEEDVVHCVGRGVTERKRAQEELHKSEARHRAVVETAEDAILTMTTNGLIRSFNPAAERIFGYKAVEVVGQPLRMLMPERFRGPHEAGFRRYQETGEAHVIGKGAVELAGLRKNGEEFPLELSLGEMRRDDDTQFTGIIRDITERKKTEHALRENEKRFRQLFNQSLDPLFIHDVSGRIVDCNEEACRSLGYTREELLSFCIRDLATNLVSDEDKRSRTEPTLWQRALSGEPGRVTGVHQGEHRRKDGTTFPVEVYVGSVDYGGERMIFASARDITERKRTEEEIRQLNETLELRVEERTEELETAVAELKEIEERYSLVVEGSNDGIWDWDIRTGELYWSDRFLDILGLSGSGVVSTFELFSELLHPGDRQRVLDAVTAHLEHNAEFNEEFQMRHSSEGYVYCVSRGKAIRDEDGRPIRMAGVVTDISERKRNEEALSFLAEASAELASSLDYHTTLASVARLTVPRFADWCAVDMLEEDGSLNRLAVVHEDPEKVRWARELQERYPPEPSASYGVAEVLRTGEPELVPEIPESLLNEAAVDDEYREILRELGLKSYMVLPLVARGRMLGAITFVTTESGWRYGPEDLELAQELARRVEMAVDNARLYDSARTELAEREQAEEEVRRLNESLERRVEERTEQLEEAREAAEAANWAKSDFLANMSHEIRTPMNGIIGMTELLFDTELSDEQRDYAETVRTSGENLLRIINDILDFSKIEAGKMRIEATDFNLHMVVEEVVGVFAERAYDKGLELASLVEYGLPTALRGDPGRLRQVLTNLMGNALKFTEEGEIVLHVNLESTTEDAVVLRFEVTDSGIGINPEQRERLFQSFSQADASTTRRYGGTGLGLAISKQLVELMGGEIGVESEPGVGSTFWFTVPLEKQLEGIPTAPRPFIAGLHDLRVLIVEDNATNRQILNTQIAPWSMHSESTEDGPKALQMLRAAAERGAAYDLAILDMQMPGMDGMQLARAIKADPAISATRLILLPSVGRRVASEEVRKAGIEAYLTKPVKQSELYDTIATVMGASAEAESPREKQLVTRHSLRENRARLLPRVLLAEDNPVNQKVATLMLEKLGYRVDVAVNGVEALEALSQSSYAVVLMDVQMPEMGGYEATAEIRRREEPEDRHTPIIAMTANAMRGDREKALESGMDDYLSKPVKREELDEVLKRWMQRGTSKEVGMPDETGAPPPDDFTYPAAAGAVAQEEDSQNPLDESVLEGLRALGDASLLAELVELFVDETPSRLAALRNAVEDEDAGTVEQTAHTLKGSCSNMGAWRMANLCAELQELGSSGELTPASGLLDQLQAEFDRVRVTLDEQTK